MSGVAETSTVGSIGPLNVINMNRDMGDDPQVLKLAGTDYRQEWKKCPAVEADIYGLKKLTE